MSNFFNLLQRFLFPRVAVILVASGTVALGSCRHEDLPSYSEFVDIDPEIWEPGSPAELSPVSADSLGSDGPYRLELNVRYLLFAPDTLRLVVSEISFDIPEKIDTLAIPLRRLNRMPSGSGSFGVYTSSTPLRSYSALPDGLRIATEPVAPVRGIVSLGLVLNPAHKTESHEP